LLAEGELVLQWLLALLLVSLLYFAWGVLFLALIYGCTLAASRLPLVGRRGTVPGARRVRDRVVGASVKKEAQQPPASQENEK
jgi:hypothetical protein